MGERKPLIGITCEEDTASRQYQLSRNYIKGIAQSGGIPLLLPFSRFLSPQALLLKKIDGFLFSGGRDLRPSLYGKKPHPMEKYMSFEKQSFEMALLSELVEQRRPVLGICLGAQMINVALGGTLLQHVEGHRRPLSHILKRNGFLSRGSPSPCPLPKREREVTGKFNACRYILHSVQIERGTLLSRILGVARARVSSSHHQAIEKLGKSLCCSARAFDGIIEAVESPRYPFLLGVQWHPERQGRSAHARRLFSYFVRIL